MKSISGVTLDEIQHDLLAGDVPLTRMLQKVMLLGGQIGSLELRAWARRELDGYPTSNDPPPYRRTLATIFVDAVDGPRVIKGRAISPDDLPDVVRDAGVGNVVSFYQRVAELEELARRDRNFLRLTLPGGDTVARIMTAELHRTQSGITVDRVYYSVSTAALRGVVENVRTALTDLVSELVRTMPVERVEPTRMEAAAAVNYTLTGELAPVTPSAPDAEGAVPACTAAAVEPGPTECTTSVSQAGPGVWWRRIRNAGLAFALVAALSSCAGVLNHLHVLPFS